MSVPTLNMKMSSDLLSSSAPAADGNVTSTVERWKDALLDLSYANPLISLPETGMVEMSAPNDVFDPLVRRRKPLTYWDLANKNLDRAILRETGNFPARATTMETLRRLHSEATSLLEGQDINVLFVSFGILTWTDPVTGDSRRAPLILVPVTLSRNADGSGFIVTRMEEDAEVNPVLRLRLSKPDIGFALPPSPEESYLIPTSYFRNVTNLIEGREGWEVQEACCMGRFPVLKLRLFEDLAAQEVRALSHPLVGALAGAQEALDQLPAVSVPNADRLDEDEGIAKDEAQEGRFHLLDADPAQERAILAALRGQSFVLQGPPGTGKTQTITNIISECIAANKTVLLVSGRMASLDAVYQRLSDKGLGDLCMLAHSLRTSKRDILAQLETSLNSGGRGGGRASAKGKDIEEMDTLRSRLNDVAHELHRTRHPLGISLYEAHGIIADSNAAAGNISLVFDYLEPEKVSADQYKELEALVIRLAENPVLSETKRNIWAGAFRNADRADLSTAVEKALKDGETALTRLQQAGASVAQECALPLPESLKEAEWTLAVGDAVKAAPILPGAWLADDITPAELTQRRERAAAFRDRYNSFQQNHASFTNAYTSEALELSPTESPNQLLATQEEILLPLFGENWADHALNHYEELTDALGKVGRDARAAHTQLAALAQQIDVPLDETPEGRLRILRIAKRATQFDRPAAGWFQPSAAQKLMAQLDEAQIRWMQYSEKANRLFEAYTEDVLTLDHAALKETLGGIQGLSRLISPAVLRDTKVLKSVLKPGINPKDRDVNADMDFASEVKTLKAWGDDNYERYKGLFGQLFMGATTPWGRIREALTLADALSGEFPDGRVSVSLIALMVAGGEKQQNLETQQAAITTLFTDLRNHWDALRRVVPSEKIPSPQEGMVPVADWCDTHLAAVQAHHSAYQSVAGLRHEKAEKGSIRVSDLTADLENAGKLRTEQAEIEAELAQLAPLYGSYYKGTDTDWDAVCAALEGAAALRPLFTAEQPLPDALRAALEAEGGSALPTLPNALATLHSAWEAMTPVLAAWDDLFTPNYRRIETTPLQEATFAALLPWVQERLAQVGEVVRGVRVQSARDDYSIVGLDSFFDALSAKPAARSVALSAFRVRFHRLWAQAITQDIPALQGFDGEAHGKKIERFRDLDRKQLEAVPSRVREATKARAPKMFPEEVKILKGQLARRRTGEIRKLLAQMPNLLTALKPCVMMNPLSVRLFLDADALNFDVVLFDDASQIATEDAIGAILRGKQVIIAGDPKQLPPLSILRETGADFESVLDAASAVAAKDSPRFARHTLNWHYRSQNESLIAFSRRHFYPDLVSFPAANAESAIRYLSVAEEADDEARIKRVVDTILEYAHKYPQHTAGVVTLNDADHDRIREEIARRREEDPAAAPLPGEGRVKPVLEEGEDAPPADEESEGFFVKTIENVQGDERDMVLLYIAEPEKCTALRQPGGDRLLNVATTRARRHMIVASALSPDDVITTGEEYSASATEALRLLQEFLRYAQTEAASEIEGSFEKVEETSDTSTDTTLHFEQVVEKALKARGLVLRRRVGVSSYRIDLAVVDPKQPDRYLLGIETDGDTYGSAATARHRDRLRHEMLTERGWRLHRIWSQDWAADPDKQLRRIEAALERVKPLK
jgi:very-short-patch-repair endonuclease